MAKRYTHLQLDRQICFALHAASRAVVRAYGPLLADVGLTYPQYLALLALWESPDESLTVGELGRRLHLDSGTLTPLLRRLEGLGYVRRARDTADERRVLVSVTADGLALRDQVAHVPAELFASLQMDLDEGRDLLVRLKQLTADLEIQEAGQTSSTSSG